MKEIEKYSGIDKIPRGQASEKLVPGCLVLEGGAFRGVYTSGVLDAWMQQDINLQTVVGVSAGALNGYNYVSGQIGRSGRINLGHRHDSHYVGPRNFITDKGVIGFNFLFNEYPQEEPLNVERFNRPEQRYLAAVTNCETGTQMYFEKGKCKDIDQAVRASASMQLFSKMVRVEGIKCLDGGGSRRIPLQFALNEGFEKIVVVRTREKGYRREEKPETLQAKVYRHYPQYAKSLLNGNYEYNKECDRIDRMEAEGRLFQMAPSQPINISRLEGDMEKLGDLYWLGYEDGMKAVPALKAYLNME